MEFGGGGGGGQDLDFQNRRSFNPRTKDSGGGYHQTGRARPGNDPLSRTESNRTLLDIIREEGGGQKDSRKTWRHFKDKLRRRNSGRGSTWTSTVTVPTSDIPINGHHNSNTNSSRMISRHPSTRINSGFDSDPTDQPDISAVPDARIPSLNRNPSRAIERASGRFDPSGPSTMRRLRREEKHDHEDDDEEDDEEAAVEVDDDGEEESSGGEDGKKDSDEEEEGEQRPVRMSLMSLLAETDNDGLAYMMDEEDDDDDDGGAGYNNCCVCMVRHKGTAFVPCGHSFCRLCSRELWVERGNCPLCNNYILEILDIF